MNETMKQTWFCFAQIAFSHAAALTGKSTFVETKKVGCCLFHSVLYYAWEVLKREFKRKNYFHNNIYWKIIMDNPKSNSNSKNIIKNWINWFNWNNNSAGWFNSLPVWFIYFFTPQHKLSPACAPIPEKLLSFELNPFPWFPCTFCHFSNRKVGDYMHL